MGIGVDSDGNVDTWGNNSNLTSVPSGEYQIADCQHDSCCRVMTDGSLTCWGISPQLNPPPSGTYTTVELGYVSGLSACALSTTGSIGCW